MSTFDDFLSEFKAANRSSTAQTYGYLKIPFDRWLAQNNRDIGKYTANDVQDYLSARGDLSDRSKNAVLTMLKRFARWGIARTPDIQERMRLEQIRGILHFKVERKLKRRALSLEELKLLIDVADEKTATLIYLLAYTGIRKSELSSLPKADFEQNRLVVWSQKSKSERVLYFNSEFKRVLKTALDRGYLNTLPSSLNNRFKKYNHVLDGIKLTPHVLRRTFNVHTRRRISDSLLRVLMGHSEKTMTDVYDEALESEIKQAMVEKHYLADFICPFRLKEVS